MIIPELPSYLDAMGGEDYKGLIIGLFAGTALIARPFSGKMADTVGRIPVMYVGPLVCVVLGFLYPYFTTIWGFLLLRFLHGFSTGFKPTGTTAYLADIVPPHKRGEAMGILGVAGSIGMASGPAIGSYIATTYSLDIMFYSSSITALLSILVLLGMKETLPNTQKFGLKTFAIHPRDLIDLSVLKPSIIMLFTVYSFGTVLTVTPDFSDYLEIGNRGIFFTITLLASIVVRLFSGKASDRFGRIRVLLFGVSMLFLGMLVLGFAHTPTLFFTGAVLFGISAGINSPTIFAWTVDLADEKSRGKGMATMFIALELGIILGSVIGAWLYGNETSRLSYAFWFGAFLALSGVFYLLLLLKRRETPKRN